MLSERFDDVRSWIAALRDGSKERLGFGYEIVWGEVRHRQLGSNRLPARVVVPTLDDALRLIGAADNAARFADAAMATLQTFPELHAWVVARPLVLLEHAHAWERVLRVLAWFRTHQRPGIYLRQIDVPGVDTKFVEARKSLLAELLDLVLPAEAIDASASGMRAFEQRYGLQAKPTMIRFRVLDDRPLAGPFSDVAIPLHELSRAALDVDDVFITENEANGLAFRASRAASSSSGSATASRSWLRRHGWRRNGCTTGATSIRTASPSSIDFAAISRTCVRSSWIATPSSNTALCGHTKHSPSVRCSTG